MWRKCEKASPYSWDSPWGIGRPGWHIEDTAISIKNFGPQYDIHIGGVELIFPHHEAEIAQAEALTGKHPFVRYWLHIGLLMLRGAKMSKSLGNIITIRDALQKYDAKALRFLFATLHYRRTVRFDLSLLKRVSEDLKLIRGSLAKFREISVSRKRTVSDRRLLNATFEAKRQFIKSMDDDFDVEAGAKCFVGLVMRLANFAKHYAQVNEKVAAKSMSTVQDMAEVFGIWPL